jgi:hypothetical protein
VFRHIFKIHVIYMYGLRRSHWERRDHTSYNIRPIMECMGITRESGDCITRINSSSFSTNPTLKFPREHDLRLFSATSVVVVRNPITREIRKVTYVQTLLSKFSTCQRVSRDAWVPIL